MGLLKLPFTTTTTKNTVLSINLFLQISITFFFLIKSHIFMVNKYITLPLAITLKIKLSHSKLLIYNEMELNPNIWFVLIFMILHSSNISSELIWNWEYFKEASNIRLNFWTWKKSHINQKHNFCLASNSCSTINLKSYF